MKIKLLFQRVYFKSSEWKDVLSYFNSFNISLNVLLLSKHSLFLPLKGIKEQLLGECFLVEFNGLNFMDLSFCFAFINKVVGKYVNRLFFIGFLFDINNKYYFFSNNLINQYFSYLTYRKTNYKLENTINLLFLYNFLKLLKVHNVRTNTSMSLLKSKQTFFFFNYYY
jgi:hypothetical protein